MSNDYFDNTDVLQPGTKAKSEDVNAKFNAVDAGFDMLPKPRSGEKGFDEAFKIVDPVDPKNPVSKQWAETAMTSQVQQAASSAAESLSHKNSADSSAAQAAGHESKAEKWADNPVDQEVEAGAFSARHWAQKAAETSSDADTLGGKDGAFYQNADNLDSGTVPEARLPASSETVKGALKLATQALTDALANDNTAVTPKKLGVVLTAILQNFLRSDEAGTATGLLQLMGGFRAASKEPPNNGDITQRLDGGFYQYPTPTEAKGWPAGITSWAHLLVLTHDNASNYYSMQLCGSFHDSNDVYYRIIDQNGPEPWKKLWHAGNQGENSGMDADTVHGVAPSQSPQANTLVERDANADVQGRLFRSEFGTTNSTINYIMTQIGNGSNPDNHVRPSTLTQLIAALSANGLLTRINQATTAIDEARLPFRMDQNVRTASIVQFLQLLVGGGNIGGLLIDGGDHRITSNDGGGNFNIRVGNKFEDGKIVYTEAGKGAIHFNGAHENTDPYVEIAISQDATDKAIGDPVTWAIKLVLKADGSITWGANTVWHEGNLPDAFYGKGQTWQDLLSSRASGVTYTNNTGKPISVAVMTKASGSGSSAYGCAVYVNGQQVAYDYYYAATDAYRVSTVYTVPDGATYRADVQGSGVLNKWRELR